VPKNIVATGYLAATLMVTTMKLAKLKEVFEIAITSSSQSVLVPLARFARLALLAYVVYTLKDGADRGILDGTSFIQLNFLSSASFGALAAYVLKEGTAGLGGAAAFFSVFCAFNGVVSTLKRKSQ